ncbi:TlpA disulfide reductase family protein [Saccharopolyspora sp. SCSIO 74807]|uniref:TlpA disulfide reductase family protein n=1 Tax=Saccharopolyspora sp. SCSIO 74807 TaxID=3118084 RepID=UPI00387E423D
MRSKRLWSTLPIVAALLVSACTVGTNSSAGDEFTFVSPGGQTRIFYDPPHTRGRITALAGDDLLRPGRKISLADFRNAVVVLNVWGSWCGPCREEMPHLQRVQEQTARSGVQVLGVDVRDGARSAPVDFVRDIGITYPSIYDPSGRALLALKGYPRSVVPSTVVLDRRHRVAAIFLTQVDDSQLLPVVRRIAAEPDQGPA